MKNCVEAYTNLFTMRTTVYETLEKEEFLPRLWESDAESNTKKNIITYHLAVFLSLSIWQQRVFRDLLQTGKCLWFKDIGHRITLRSFSCKLFLHWHSWSFGSNPICEKSGSENSDPKWAYSFLWLLQKDIGRQEDNFTDRWWNGNWIPLKLRNSTRT